MQLISAVEIDLHPLVVAALDTSPLQGSRHRLPVKAELLSQLPNRPTGGVPSHEVGTLRDGRSTPPLGHGTWQIGTPRWQIQQPPDAFPLVREVRIVR